MEKQNKILYYILLTPKYYKIENKWTGIIHNKINRTLWTLDGRLHNVNGPAIIRPSIDYENNHELFKGYRLFGDYYTYKKWKIAVKKIKNNE